VSLVDDDPFEEGLSVSTVAHQVEADQGLVLANPQRRYGALGGLPLERATNPFGPEAICGAFQEALGPLEHAMPVRTVTYRVFGAALRSRCEVLYTALNAQLAPLDDRLGRPLLKVARRDPAVLESAEHPARRTVDLIERYAIATDEQGRFFDESLRRHLHELVERVTARGEEDPALFGRASEVLARLIEPIRATRRARVARLQEACEARDRIRRARLRVADALATRVGGRGLPEPMLRLLDAGWRQHLVLQAMRDGEAGDGLDEGLAAIDRLLERLGTGIGADARPAFREAWTARLNRIESAPGAVSVDPALRAASIEGLEQALPGVDAAPMSLVPVRSSGSGGRTNSTCG